MRIFNIDEHMGLDLAVDAVIRPVEALKSKLRKIATVTSSQITDHLGEIKRHENNITNKRKTLDRINTILTGVTSIFPDGPASIK